MTGVFLARVPWFPSAEWHHEGSTVQDTHGEERQASFSPRCRGKEGQRDAETEGGEGEGIDGPHRRLGGHVEQRKRQLVPDEHRMDQPLRRRGCQGSKKGEKAGFAAKSTKVSTIVQCISIIRVSIVGRSACCLGEEIPALQVRFPVLEIVLRGLCAPVHRADM